MRVLFISSNLLNSKNGGWQCSNRNYESIKELASYIEIYHVRPNNKKNGKLSFLWNVLNLIRFYSGGINKKHIYNISNILIKDEYDVVFFDSSVYGRLVKHVKINFPTIKLVSFYHNVEFIFIKRLIYTGGLLHIFRIPACYLNERLTAKWSDQIICLTKEDEESIHRLYTKKNLVIIPISFKPAINIDRVSHNDDFVSILFVGSYFYANVQGIKWFLNKVKLPSNVKLLIVGKDMHKLSSLVTGMQNIEIRSNVESLTEFYQRANAVICPLFYGGGMKVKVAEALMHGKKVIGTPLAFYGYRFEECSSLISASTKEEFTEAINALNLNDKYFKQSFSHFNSYFSHSATLNLFCTILKK